MPELNFNVLAQQGPQNFMQGYAQGSELRNRMAQQRQQEQLADLQVQNALREQRMAGEEEAAYKAAGSDMGRLQQELMQRGLGKQSMAVGAQLAKQQTDKMAMLKQQHDLIKTAAAQVFANPENAIQSLTAFGNRTGIDMSDDLAQIQALGNDPAKIKQWAAGIAMEADKLLPQLNTRDIGGQVQDRLYNPVTGRVEVIGTTAKTIDPGAAARLNFDREKFNWEKANPGMEIKEGPNGEMLAVNKRTGEAKPVTMGGVVVAGGGGSATEGERKAATLYGRLQQAEATMKDVLQSETGGKAAPGVFEGKRPNIIKSTERQRVEAAQLDFLDAALTLSTGAAYTKEQLAGAIQTYFPKYGDDAATIADKEARRAHLVEMAKLAAGKAASKVTPPAPKPTAGKTPAASNIDALLDKYK